MGVLLSGVGQGLTIVADLGLAPWDVFHQALSNIMGWSIGQVVILVSFLTVLCWIPLKQKPGIGTLLGIVLVGLLIDLTIHVSPEPTSMPAKWGYLLSGILIFGLGICLFVNANLGVGPRDGLMVGIAKKGLSIQKTRLLIDGIAFTAGWVLGGKVGIGTVVIVLGVGPSVQFSMKMTSAWSYGPLHTGAAHEKQ